MGDVALDVIRMLANSDERLVHTDVDPDFEDYRRRRKIKNVIYD